MFGGCYRSVAKRSDNGYAPRLEEQQGGVQGELHAVVWLARVAGLEESGNLINRTDLQYVIVRH